MILNNWLERFWQMVGTHLNGRRHSFGSMQCPKGTGVYQQPTEFHCGKVWFTAHNPKNVAADWSQINLVRVTPVPDGLAVVADVKSDECKVSWFVHA